MTPKTKKFEVVFEVSVDIEIPELMLQMIVGDDKETAKIIATYALQTSTQFTNLLDAGGNIETFWNHVSTRKVTNK